MPRFQSLYLLTAFACLLSLTGCFVVKDSPAPGCVETIGIPAVGGCFGKTAIVDLAVASAPECIQVEANNCNGGVLEIRNACAETVRLDGIEIPPAGSASLDFVEKDGGFEVFEAHGNFSQYKPEADKQIEIQGVVGDQAIDLIFTKTAPLCE